MVCAAGKGADRTEFTGQQLCDLNTTVIQALRTWYRTHVHYEDANGDDTGYHLISTDNRLKRFFAAVLSANMLETPVPDGNSMELV